MEPLLGGYLCVEGSVGLEPSVEPHSQGRNLGIKWNEHSLLLRGRNDGDLSPCDLRYQRSRKESGPEPMADPIGI